MEENGHPDQSIWGESSLHQTRGAPIRRGDGCQLAAVLAALARHGRRSRRHAPDFFARLGSGMGVVIDVRADDRIEPGDAEAFAMTNRACEAAGWEFRRVGVVDPVLAANVRWLSRDRHPRCSGPPGVADALRHAFAAPAPLLAGAARAGDSLAVLPVLFHLMWCQVLAADLGSGPLGSASLAWLAEGVR